MKVLWKDKISEKMMKKHENYPEKNNLQCCWGIKNDLIHLKVNSTHSSTTQIPNHDHITFIYYIKIHLTAATAINKIDDDWGGSICDWLNWHKCVNVHIWHHTREWNGVTKKKKAYKVLLHHVDVFFLYEYTYMQYPILTYTLISA